MKTEHHFTVVSVLLNVALAVAAWRISSPAAPTGISLSPEKSAPVDNRVVRRTNGSRVEVTVTNEAPPFHWSQVQSEDLEKYVTNLRGIGCPQSSVRDIIQGALTDQYLERRRLLMEPIQKEYWDLNVQGYKAIMTRLQGPLELLQKETLGRLDALVGNKPETRRPNRRHVEMADFLPDEKRQQFVALNQQFDDQQRVLQQEKGDDRGKRAEKLKDLQRQRDEAIQALLSPEELSEYKLRNSRFAQVGANLVGIELSQDELRALTRTYEQFEAASNTPDRKEPDREAKLAAQKEAQRQRDEAVKNLLGEERFADYQRGGDGRFQEIYQVTERYQLPRETAVQADDLRKAALEAARQIQRQTALSSEERLAALQQIQQETQAALRQVFGPRAATTYQENGGSWLRDMTDSP